MKVFSLTALIFVLLQVSNYQITITPFSLLQATLERSLAHSSENEVDTDFVVNHGTIEEDLAKKNKKKPKVENPKESKEENKERKKIEKEAKKRAKKFEKEQKKLQKEQEKKKKKQKKLEKKQKKNKSSQSDSTVESKTVESRNIEQGKKTCITTESCSLMTLQMEIFTKSLSIQRFTPTQFVPGFDSSIIGLEDDLQNIIENERKEISKFNSQLAIYTVKITNKTKEILMKVDNTIKNDEIFKNEVVASFEKLSLHRKCSNEFVKGAGSLLVNLQQKNDVLQAKVILLTKLISKIQLKTNLSEDEKYELQDLEEILKAHKDTISTRSGYISDVFAIVFVCEKRNYISSQIVCAPTSNYLPNPRSCTTEELVQLLEKMIYYTIMRVTENSYLQSCSDKFTQCNELCSEGEASCLDCFTSALCKRVHLNRKHQYGKYLINTANKAYECETFIFKMLKEKESQTVTVF